MREASIEVDHGPRPAGYPLSVRRQHRLEPRLPEAEDGAAVDFPAPPPARDHERVPSLAPAAERCPAAELDTEPAAGAQLCRDHPVGEHLVEARHTHEAAVLSGQPRRGVVGACGCGVGVAVGATRPRSASLCRPVVHQVEDALDGDAATLRRDAVVGVQEQLAGRRVPVYVAHPGTKGEHGDTATATQPQPHSHTHKRGQRTWWLVVRR